MLRKNSLLALVIGLAAFGLNMGNVQPGGVAAAQELNTPMPQWADGQPMENGTLSGPEVAAAPAAISGPVYTRTYTGSEFDGAPSELTSGSLGLSIYAVSANPSSHSFKLHLDLPNGAQVTKVTMFAVDNDPVKNVTVQISRANPALDYLQTPLATLSTINGVPAGTVQAISYTGLPILTVDNATYAYILRYQPSVAGSSHLLYGARVEYSLPTLFIAVVR
jgi:hypothetical protein